MNTVILNPSIQHASIPFIAPKLFTAKAINNKLRSIVRMIFNDPELNLRVEYTLFDRQTGYSICIGNGEACQRSEQKGFTKSVRAIN